MSKPKKLDITLDKLIDIAKAINENIIANKTKPKEQRVCTDSFIRKFGIVRKDFSETIKGTPIKYNPSIFLYEIPDNYQSNTKVLPTEIKENQHVYPGNTEVIPKESNTSIAISKEIVAAVKNTIDMEYPELQNLINWFKKEQEQKHIINIPELNINHPKLQGEIVSKSFKTYRSVIDDFVDFSKNRKETQKDIESNFITKNKTKFAQIKNIKNYAFFMFCNNNG